VPNIAFCPYKKVAVFLLLLPLSPAFLLLFLAFLLLLPDCLIRQASKRPAAKAPKERPRHTQTAWQ
jgi:hypothetical protein